MKNATSLYLEHANITVTDLNNAIRFIQTAFPDFEIRGSGHNSNRDWVHIGNQQTYLALNNGGKDQITKNYNGTGINHLGFVVQDAEAVAQRLSEAGYQRSYPRQAETFRIREYFYDADGMEYEFIQYLSDKNTERNQYE